MEEDDNEVFEFVKNFTGDIESWNSEENQKEFENLLDKVCNKYHKVFVPTTTLHKETQTEVTKSSMQTQTESTLSTIIKVGYNKALNFKN